MPRFLRLLSFRLFPSSFVCAGSASARLLQRYCAAPLAHFVVHAAPLPSHLVSHTRCCRWRPGDVAMLRGDSALFLLSSSLPSWPPSMCFSTLRSACSLFSLIFLLISLVFSGFLRFSVSFSCLPSISGVPLRVSLIFYTFLGGFPPISPFFLSVSSHRLTHIGCFSFRASTSGLEMAAQR